MKVLSFAISESRQKSDELIKSKMKNVKETVAEQLAQGFYLSTVPLLTDNKAPWRRCLLAIMQKSISNNACVRTCAETRDWSVSAQTCLLLV